MTKGAGQWGLSSTVASLLVLSQVLAGCGAKGDKAPQGNPARPLGDVRVPKAEYARRAVVRAASTNSHVGSSPFDPPKHNDTTFVVDQGAGLDTGCSFHSGGPLVFQIPVDRVVGDRDKLKQNGMISDTAILEMPAFDVDSETVVSGINPERDRVWFNGNVVPTEFLRGANDTWRQNTFRIPIEWIRFPSDGGHGSTPTAVSNEVKIEIDTANPGEDAWCVAIDWAALSIERIARPVVMAHGIFSSGGTWAPPQSPWVPGLDALGLPNSNNLNMGWLDSIGSNAQKIAVEIEDAKKRWGVDQVVIVAHSKGGLDSRHYVETNSSVERVVQLGTPNAGSPLADFVEKGYFKLAWRLGGFAGLGGAVLFNLLAAPAGLQLTQPFMSYYNSVHGRNSKVGYTALAGDYDPGCCKPLWWALQRITGNGDTIVPVSSVHALSYTDDLTFSSAGSDEQAVHTQLTKSPGVFNMVIGRVKTSGAKAFAKHEAVATTVAQTASVVDTISTGVTRTFTTYVDQPGETLVSVFYQSGELALKLTSPSGKVYDSNTPATDPTVSYQNEEILGGKALMYAFQSAESGKWTVEVTATSVPGTTTFLAGTWIVNPKIVFRGSLISSNVHLGDALELLGTLTNDGGALTGATVAAKVGLPDGTSVDVTLVDDGTGSDKVANDGIYSGKLPSTTQSGTYGILFTASRIGSSAGPDFTREDFGLATVSASSSTFNGSIKDYGSDTDANGLYNELLLDVGLTITSSATYRVYGVLADLKGNLHEANAVATLAPGAATVTLHFDGGAFFSNGVNGPYSLTTLRLAEETAIDILPLAERPTAFDTAAYTYDQFEHGALLLTGSGTSVGIDTNANGKYDSLEVGVGVRADVGGSYEWSAELEDVAGTLLGFSSGSGTFTSGVNTITLTFGGLPIGANGIDGPYYVTNLLLFGAGHSLTVRKAFTTDAFLASSFEGYVSRCKKPSDCDPGYYLGGTCDGSHDNTECLPCSGACPSGQSVAVGCTATADRICTPCPTSCPTANMYLTGSCSCLTCSGPCPAGQYQTSECNAIADRVCAPCSGACPAGTYLAAACTATADRICLPSPGGVGPVDKADAGTDAGLVPSSLADAATDAGLAPSSLDDAGTGPSADAEIIVATVDAGTDTAPTGLPKYDAQLDVELPSMDLGASTTSDTASVKGDTAIDAATITPTTDAATITPTVDGGADLPVSPNVDASVARDSGLVTSDGNLPTRLDAAVGPAVDAGTRPPSIDAGTKDAATPKSDSSSGCSCNVGGPSSSKPALAGVFVALGLIVTAIRRRKSAR